ncbi:MAG: hypothetical protein NVS4B12_10160 [Ktedonobacteraceae bacterium]
MPNFKILPRIFPIPTTAAPLAAPDISECMTGVSSPCILAISLNTIMGIVSNFSVHRS